MLLKTPSKQLLHLMFNNIEYQNYSPLYAERYSMNPDYYLTYLDTKRLYNELRKVTQRILVGAPKPFQHVACRMGIAAARTKEQADYWMSMSGYSKLKKHDRHYYHKALIDTGVLDTPQRFINKSTGEIIVKPN
jgi:hypothetical protein